jgi:hypothetical protein
MTVQVASVLSSIAMYSDPIAHISRFQDFLASLVLQPKASGIKTVEMDLKGRLNPAPLLDELFFGQQQWLSFEQFYKYYLHRYSAELKALANDMPWDDFCQGLKARLYRTQFGLLTEYHAFFACQCIFGMQAVSRDPELDRLGVDFSISFAQQPYHIHIFVDNQRAWSFRNYKSASKLVNTLPGVHVNLPYSLAQGRFNSLRYLPNGFGIYTSAYLRYFKAELEAGHIKHNNIVGTRPQGFVYSH